MLKNVGLIGKPSKLLLNLRKQSMLMDCTRFGLFLMCFNTLYKLVLCLMRRFISEKDSVNAPVAGFFSALSLIIDVGSRRQLLTVLVMSRAIDTSLKLGESTQSIPTVRHKDVILWVLANVFLQSSMGLNQDILNKGLLKFYKTWAQMTTND